MSRLIHIFALSLFSLSLHAQLSSILDCVEYNPNKSDPATGPFITAHWGYVNTGLTEKTVNPGPGNFFTPAPSYEGQPIVFETNIHHQVFTTTFYLNVTGSSSWHLQGITETASNDPSKYCAGSNVACWDTNANGVCDPSEDVNGDGTCDARDCQGRTGAVGATGPQGLQGPAGPAGAQGPAGISPAIRTATAASTTQTATATCNASEFLLNGGGTCTVPNTNIISGKAASSVPSGTNGWTISCSNGQATAVALCSTKQ